MLINPKFIHIGRRNVELKMHLQNPNSHVWVNLRFIAIDWVHSVQKIYINAVSFSIKVSMVKSFT